VLGQGIALAGVGIVFGLAASALTTGYLRSLLFGVEPEDIATFAELAALFAVVALIASYVPARRATRIDPCVALRTE
jgi:ABC-type antimicrobial peptide transport system permease subunit